MSRLFLYVSFALTTAPALGMTQYIPELRELTRQGNASLEYIMGVVMMNLPPQLMSRLQAKLTLRTPNNRVFGVSPGLGSGFPVPSGSFPFSFPSPQGQAGGGSDSSIDKNSNSENSKDDSSDTGTITNINSDEPILLAAAGRKKRSFDFFDRGSFHTGPFHPAGTFGKSGYNGYGTFHHSEGTYGGHGHVNHPSDQNGNLFGGTATGYINYPGSGHHHSSYNSFHGPRFGGGGFNKENCPRQADQGFVYQYDADSLTYPGIEIGNELFVRSLPGSDLLFQALSLQIVFPTDPPQIFIDEL
ncbi:hypothetical protein ElyMa_001549900 [Elysia marginata]|uniref:Uncharacterized protein n=1 Tax=Elysia marginata TaxID=1093978 RepID=A0AAV4JD69_9GAST|nr:hypothetical protein ElyMa_001549900 [Elysia marginata]